MQPAAYPTPARGAPSPHLTCLHSLGLPLLPRGNPLGTVGAGEPDSGGRVSQNRPHTHSICPPGGSLADTPGVKGHPDAFAISSTRTHMRLTKHRLGHHLRYNLGDISRKCELKVVPFYPNTRGYFNYLHEKDGPF